MEYEIKFTPEEDGFKKLKIKTLFKTKLILNGYEGTIFVNDIEDYGDCDDDKIVNAYGVTNHIDNNIKLFGNKIVKDNLKFQEVLYHEVGHAGIQSMPGHIKGEDGSDISAEAGESAGRFSGQLSKISKDFKNKIIKNGGGK